ncbi:MAG: ABC transporter ATP-binding protein [Candidatus Synoicihabitans palmerolidicus]|nr:ABC transporter ATP-binding protein [Candidatus Synoicihabitans palmerolidicus]
MFNNGSSQTFAQMFVVVFVVGFIGLLFDRVMIVLQRLVSFDGGTTAICSRLDFKRRLPQRRSFGPHSSIITPRMSSLELDSVSVGCGPSNNRTEVLSNVNLAVEENEFVAIIGFPGSGKSTLVNLLAGLQMPDTGTVKMSGELVTAPGPERGIVFQNYSLLPWLSVSENIDLAVKSVFSKFRKNQRREHVARYIEMVNLTPARNKKPSELSGGMRQRVSLARTLAMQPGVLLLDETLSALDALTRANLQDEITRILEQDRRTVVLITNDVDEALLLADRIIPLTMGPRATLASAFPNTLERPRDRTAMNHDPAFKHLKPEITNYLLTFNREAKSLRVDDVLEMPMVLPADFSTGRRLPPIAVQHAGTVSANAKRNADPSDSSSHAA